MNTTNEDKRKGIVSGHSYSVLSVHEFRHERKDVKLLQLRNPFGDTEWEGDWSDNSDKWTPKLRKELGAEAVEDEGIFFIPLENYIENFRCTNINYETSSDSTNPQKVSSVEYDFATEGDGEEAYQIAAFGINVSKTIDLTNEVFSVSINQ